MIRTYAADRPFRVRFMPTCVGVPEGQRAAEIKVADFASLEQAMVAKDGPDPGYAADRITRGGDHVVVWPLRDLSPGIDVWIDETPEGGFAVKGVLVSLFGMSDQMDRLWQVRLEGDETLQVVPEKLLRPRY